MNWTALTARIPLFFQTADASESWGSGRTATNCSACWDPGVPGNGTGTKFWGFCAAVMDVALVYAANGGVSSFASMGYLYRFARVFHDGMEQSIAESSPPPVESDAPVSALVDQAGTTWKLYVAAAGGWTPAWQNPVIALVVVLSAVVSTMLAALMVIYVAYKDHLESVLPHKVIRALRQSGSNPVGGPLVFAERFSSVTVLFADIVSYTSMTASMDPMQVVRLLNDLYSRFDKLIDKHGIYKVETVGDAFMACGGVPESLPAEEGAARVARFARDMIKDAAGFTSVEGVRVQMRVGMHSGPVVAAVIGTKMPHYTLVGDTVNTASRHETNSSPNRVLVSEACAQLLLLKAPEFELLARGKVDMKGKGMLSTFWLRMPDEVERLDSEHQPDSVVQPRVTLHVT